MNKIQFSHKYDKLGYGENKAEFVRLLQIFKCHYKDLSERFIKQDTLYWEKGASYQEAKYYTLPKTKLIILIFINLNDNRFRLFTTVRKHTPKKYEYYKSKMGEIFEVEIKED